MEKSWEKLIDGLKRGHIRSLSRLISKVENRDLGWKNAMKEIYPLTGSARVFGITGSPGAGKSTLTSEIAHELLDSGYRLGIIAVDPSSPFSGGALLGDRLRMQKLFTRDDVFIRSMATRGMLGGLCQAARDVVRILDAFGKDIIIIETVGVGQDEIEVVRTADVVMVVCIPGQGDGVQAIKAGVMEIADIFVVNKADREGADEVVADISAMIELSHASGGAILPVLKTSALKNEGIKELVTVLINQMNHKSSHDSKTSQFIKEEILTLMEREVFRYVRNQWDQNDVLDQQVKQVIDGLNDPYSIVETLMPLTLRGEI